MEAALFADVLVGDFHPAVALGLADHALDRFAVALLDVHARGQFPPRLAQPRGKRVAHALQLADPEHARSAGGGDSHLDPRAGIDRREMLGETELQVGDLAAQLRSGAPLRVAIGDERW